MGRIKRFIKTAGTYLAGNVLSKLVSFFLIPLYTNKLTTTDYGDYDVVITMITLLVAVAFFQLWDGMFRFSFDFEDNDDKYRIINVCMKGYGLGLIVFSIAFIVLSKVMPLTYPLLTYVFGILFGLQYMYSFAARVFLLNNLFVASGLANTLTIAATNIVLILYYHMGVQSLYYAQIAGGLVQIIIIEKKLKLFSNTCNTFFSITLFKRILKFSLPLCIATVSYWLLSGYTKIVINSICGSNENGLFAVASSFAGMAVIAVNVFQFAWNETAYLMANEKTRISTYRKCIDLLFCTVWICCAAFCSAISIIFPYFVGKSFQESAVVIPYLMIGISANAIAGFLGTLFMTEQKTSYIMISTLAAAFTNIALSGRFTRSSGLIGAVVVLSASFILLLLLRLIYIKRTMGITVSAVSLLSILTVVPSIIIYTHSMGVMVNIAYILFLIFCYFIAAQNITGLRVKEVINTITRKKE